MKLTQTNYYTNTNRYLSNSKISDYLKSKKFFYKKHVIGGEENKETPALIIGKAVDLWLTKGRQHFEQGYIRVARKSSKIDPKLIQLTEREYDEVVGICEAVEKTSAYQKLRGYKKQQILQYDFKVEMGKESNDIFKGLCGIPDFYKIDKEGHCIIIDLKTSRTIDKKKYYYHALEFGYFRQQAMYQKLLRELRPEIKTIESRHLVVEKDPDGIYKVKTFKLKQSEIDTEYDKLIDIVLDIRREKKWEDEDATWDKMEELGDPRVKEFNGVNFEE